MNFRLKAMGITALLLSAGLGTRLKPITDLCPKCLVKIGSQPILGDWLDKLESIGCEKTIINTHYLHQQVDSYLSSRRVSKMIIETRYESELLGTGATIVHNRSDLENDTIIVIHADNFTNMDIGELIRAHKTRPESCIMTMLTFTADNPESCGIVKKNADGIVLEFHEKSLNAYGNCANGAIYVFDKVLLNELCSMNLVRNFTTDVIPELMHRVYSYHTDSVYIDIGTAENLAKARRFQKTNSMSV